MIFDITQRLAIWKPGEHKWTVIPTTNNWIFDVCFFKGELYAIDHLGKIIAFGVEVAKQPPGTVVDLIDQGVLLRQSTGQLYLVEAESTLLVIHRYVHLAGDDDEPDYPKIDEAHYRTTKFEIYELDVDNWKAKEVEGVGKRAIFVGLGSSTFSVDASLDKCGCKANCIYFTDDNIEAYCSSKLGGGSDMGVYRLDEKIIDRFYKGPSQFCFITPPIWVERPHY
ncbi:putative F-box protein At5g55150 [Chenopodium quinoa]|nr:putative F-box protein At5g55150 [Chenopodium quinoa]